LNIAVMILFGDTPLVTKKMSEVPAVGDYIEVGKSTTPKHYIVTGRRWRDSTDDWTRVDVYVEEPPMAKKRRSR
jgi:hypothetical protein